MREHLSRRQQGSGQSPDEQGIAAGLLARKAETGRTYDRFRDRIIFPIVNLADEIVGFGGRLIGAGEPKYLNSPETAAFSKGENLYGVGLAREGIRKAGHAVLVEGYMDVIALHEAGVTQVVATLGTGFTPGHVRLLRRFTERVVVNFDPDAAGRAATRRSIEVLLESGFEVQVVTLPAGKDPDVFVREEGVEAYRERVAASRSYIEYLTREVASRVDLAQPRGKVAALNEVLPFLSRLDHPVRRAGYVEMIANVLGIEDRLVLQELKEAVRARRHTVGPKAEAALDGRVREAESRLIRVLMDAADARPVLLNEIEGGDLGASIIVEIVKAIRRLVERGESVTYPRVGAAISEGGRDTLTRIAAMSIPPPTLDDGRGCLRALRASGFERQMREIQKRLESDGGVAEIDELLRRKVMLKKRIEALRQASA
jgi:DNA primase